MLNRRNFMKACGAIIAAPVALLKADKPVLVHPSDISNKLFAVPKSERIYLNYYHIEQTTQKPLMRILDRENNLKYTYLPLDEVHYSDKPLPRQYIEFESIEPLGIGDLVAIENNRWEPRNTEYIIIALEPVFDDCHSVKVMWRI